MRYFSPSLLDASVTTAKIADGAVATAKLADVAVTSGKLADNAVGANKLAGGAVGGNKLATDAVTQVKIATSETSLAGGVPGNGSVDLVLAAYTFWPMIHVQDLDNVRVTGHTVDSPGANNARLGLTNNAAGGQDYDLDYRNID